MTKLSIEEMNAVRDVARQCSDAIKKSPEEKAEAKLERRCTSDPEGVPREGETDGRKSGDV
ncbi:hypothetical protein AWI17_02220 [Enterobacter asburiae]|uniref:hypothetical protein n=1 Tax=Enterobacter asburiae TaxID=61645 RepID=UPI00075056FF|nr:hypothetical protein AWI17_02220 [Enterobacter asburiae]